MEHADSGDLLQRIRQHRENKSFFQEQNIWNIFIQIIQALKALHDNHIVHRDMKSANVLLCKDGRVKLADFNVSKIVKNNMIKTQIGTPFYASPEIWNYTPYDYKADIWSLGCILYEMCCLKTPFLGQDMQAICKRVCKGQYQKIPSIYSNELSNLIKIMLQINPQVRPDCDRLIQEQSVQNHIRHSNNQTLLFSTISDRNFELLSTIQWSKYRISEDFPITTQDQTLTKKSNPQQKIVPRQIQLRKNHRSVQEESLPSSKDDYFSVRLPPPHYTPVSNQRRKDHSYHEYPLKQEYDTLQDNPYKQDQLLLQSIQPQIDNKAQLKKRVIKRNRVNSDHSKYNQRSLEQESDSPELKHKRDYSMPYNHYIEESLIQEEIEEETSKIKYRVIRSKPKVQLKPLNNMAYQNSNRKLQVRTETSQSKRIKIFSAQNSQDGKPQGIQQSHQPEDIINLSQQNIKSRNSSLDLTDQLINDELLHPGQNPPRQIHRHSINETPSISSAYDKILKNESYSRRNQKQIYQSFDKRDLSKNTNLQSTPDDDYLDRDKQKSRKQIQIKQIIDLLQGNPLNKATLKSTNSNTNKNMRQDVLQLKNHTLIKSKQEIDEMKQIKSQMQDIHNAIQKSIQQNQNGKRDKLYDLIKKEKRF